MSIVANERAKRDERDIFMIVILKQKKNIGAGAPISERRHLACIVRGQAASEQNNCAPLMQH
jgi:hypothetical protein